MCHQEGLIRYTYTEETTPNEGKHFEIQLRIFIIEMQYTSMQFVYMRQSSRELKHICFYQTYTHTHTNDGYSKCVWFFSLSTIDLEFMISVPGIFEWRRIDDRWKLTILNMLTHSVCTRSLILHLISPFVYTSIPCNCWYFELENETFRTIEIEVSFFVCSFQMVNSAAAIIYHVHFLLN